MKKATADGDLATRVRGSIRAKKALPWLPWLTSDLVGAAWQRLEQQPGLSRESYGTARMLLQDANETRRVITLLDIVSTDGKTRDVILVELLPDDLARQCSGSEVSFFDEGQLREVAISDCLTEALQLLAAVPTVLPTIASLVRVLHLIDAKNDDFDVSFTDPTLPFSVFVSIPGPSADRGALRVAEAILHEAMHLQLTLIEAFVPLVIRTERMYYSPWRDEYRSAQGILHALYVFRVIDWFLATAPLDDTGPSSLRQYVQERRATISRQVHEVRDFHACGDLTEDGGVFVDWLLS